VIDALAGASGLYRFASPDAEPELIVSGGSLVGVAFGHGGELVVASNEASTVSINREDREGSDLSAEARSAKVEGHQDLLI
jgi:hypothetical protein